MPSSSSSNPNPNKPLHNFPFHHLRWSVNPTNNHPSRKPPHQSLHADNASTPRSSPDNKMRVSDSPISPVQHSERKPKTKICIRLKARPIKPAGEPTKLVKQAMPAGELIEVPTKLTKHTELDDSIAKTWNLRPRMKSSHRNDGVQRLSVAAISQDASLPESSRPMATDDAHRKDKEKKDKPNKTHFSIPLSKLQIEEDFYALTASKPSRKPLKRPKHLQKQLDNLFPGTWLSSVTPQTYKVHESRPKIP